MPPAKSIGESDGVVYSSDPDSGTVLRLYPYALRSIEDVRLALKCVSEPVVGFEPLQPTE